MTPYRRRSLPPPPSRRSRGVVLLFTLLALVIMMVAGVALVRSFNASLFNAGNLAFKRDLVNQAERARADIWSALGTGALATEAARQLTAPSQNYSASVLQNNAQGIPQVLLDDSAFTTNFSGADRTVSGQAVTVRYVIDRQCAASGPATKENCALTGNTPQSCTTPCTESLTVEAEAVVYRLSIRVTGPRDTQAFLQSTFTL